MRRNLTLIEWTDPAAWDAFVRAHAESRYCQLFGYGSVVGSYRNIYRPRPLAFMRNGELVGVLPAAEVFSVLYGRRLVSQPFSEYGGMLLHPELSKEDVQAALQALQEYLTRVWGGHWKSTETMVSHRCLGESPWVRSRTCI